ncbi:MAG: PAS domain-containing sensor histidine kinase [Nitrospinae bacterium]|nr:PAS domain-containing sensor histidine kinase [Nitrospinota bacterium]
MEERFRQMFYENKAVMLLIEPETTKLLDANESACQFYGYQKDELLSKSLFDINTLPPDEILSHIGEIQNKTRNYFLVRHRLASGEIRDVESYPSPVTVGGKTLVFSIIHDVTGRKAMEKNLKTAKEEAEAANNTKDKFVSMVSHDLKTPLGVILGFMQLMRGELSDKAGENTRKMLDVSISTAENMTMFIHDVLSVSRLREGTIKPQNGFFDAALIGKKMTADYEYMAQSKGIALKSAVPDHTTIYSDRTLFTEVVQNFVTNAIKFCGKGDAVTISAEKMDGRLTIFVADTGPGIDPSITKKLFEGEGYLSAKGTEGEMGTGYGLAMTKELLKALGGGRRADGAHTYNPIFKTHRRGDYRGRERSRGRGHNHKGKNSAPSDYFRHRNAEHDRPGNARPTAKTPRDARDSGDNRIRQTRDGGARGRIRAGRQGLFDEEFGSRRLHPPRQTIRRLIVRIQKSGVRISEATKPPQPFCILTPGFCSLTPSTGRRSY